MAHQHTDSEPVPAAPPTPRAALISSQPKKGSSLVLACNIIAVICILYALFSPVFIYSTVLSLAVSWRRQSQAPISSNHAAEAEAARIRIREAFEARKALEPVELIKRVKEIKEEVYKPIEDQPLPPVKKKHASELTSRLKQIKKPGSKKNQQALEDWRKKKLGSLESKKQA